MGDLEVGQDMVFQRRMWVLQRVGWVVFCGVIVLSMLGLTGDGPLSTRTVRSADGTLQITYGRLDRHRNPSTITIDVATSLAERGSVTVWIARSFFERVQVESQKPEPESVEGAADRVSYTFSVDESQPRARLSFDVMYLGMGSRSGQIGVEGGPAVAVRQFIFP